MTALKPFYYLPYGEAKVCLDCRATCHCSLDACPSCGSRAWELVARVHGNVGAEVGEPRKKEVQDAAD